MGGPFYAPTGSSGVVGTPLLTARTSRRIARPPVEKGGTSLGPSDDRAADGRPEIQALTDENGRPSAPTRTLGHAHDLTGAEALLARGSIPRNSRQSVPMMRAGSGTGSPKGVARPSSASSHTKHPQAHDPIACHLRNGARRMVCRLKDFRYIATKYGKRADKVLSRVSPGNIAALLPGRTCRNPSIPRIGGCR